MDQDRYPRPLAGGDVACQEKQAVLDRSPTIGENIDRRIRWLQAEIERLSVVKAKLEKGESLLNIRIEDLRQAMNY